MGYQLHAGTVCAQDQNYCIHRPRHPKYHLFREADQSRLRGCLELGNSDLQRILWPRLRGCWSTTHQSSNQLTSQVNTRKCAMWSWLCGVHKQKIWFLEVTVHTVDIVENLHFQLCSENKMLNKKKLKKIIITNLTLYTSLFSVGPDDKMLWQLLSLWANSFTTVFPSRTDNRLAKVSLLHNASLAMQQSEMLWGQTWFFLIWSTFTAVWPKQWPKATDWLD